MAEKADKNKDEGKLHSKYVFREANKPEPTEKVSIQTGRVSWGDNNLQPQFLNRLYYENPIHGGIVNQKVKFTTAGGLSVEGGDVSILEDGKNPLQTVVTEISRDLELGETVCYHFTKDISTGLWDFDSMDYELIRVSEEEFFFDYSEDWSNKQQGKNQSFRRIKNIHYVSEEDTECLMRVITKPKQRSFVDSTTLTANYYPVPNYSGAITDILASIEMSFFTYSEVVNGWKGGTLVNLSNGVPDTKEKKREVERNLKMSSTDRNKQGGMILTYSDGKERAPEVHQINGNDLDKRYEQGKKTTRDNIMVAHGVISPALFAVFTESMFGSKEEMEIAYELFKENYVEARQDQILSPLNWALKKLNDFTGTIVFNDYVPAILRTKVEETTPLAEEMSKQDDSMRIISEFTKFGVSRESLKVEYSKTYDTYEDNEEDFKRSYVKSKFAVELTENQKIILTMIKNGEGYGAIKTALDISSRELSTELVELGRLEVLDGWELTDQGNELTVSTEELTVLYSYELKPNAPSLVSGGKSRPFCETLIGLDRLYTRQEINTISSNVDRDVWRYRGGWYHNPNTDVNTPSCRHTWVQNITVNL